MTNVKAKKLNVRTFQRLEHLRVVTGKTWGQLAAELHVDPSLFFHLKAGNRKLSAKVLYRLAQAELAAGITKPSETLLQKAASGKRETAVLSDKNFPLDIQVTAADFDKGYKDIRLEYRRGAAPPACPMRLRLKVPANLAIWDLMGIQGVLDDPTRLLFACLQQEYAKAHFLDLLTPRCFRQLVEVAASLAFGLNWKNQLKP